MRRTNCLFWALKQRWRYGGTIRYRQSLHGWFPHFMWIGPRAPPWHGEMFEYTPIDPVRRNSPPVLFRGYVQRLTDKGERRHG